MAEDTVPRIRNLCPSTRMPVCLGSSAGADDSDAMEQLIDIESGGLHACPVAAVVTITAHRGTVWVTHAGDLRDHVITSGRSLHLIGSRRVVVQALGGNAQFALATG